MRQAVSYILESESMASSGDRILLVEHDPEISDLIARQALRSVGYHVDVVSDSSAAIKRSVQSPPDLIIANMNLPGLSAKDLLIALTAQGVTTPLLVIARKGQEQEIIQAFRLGAADYLLWPARDAEVIAAVERVLSRVHELRDRQRLDLKLNETNQQLQRRARELTAIVNIGKAVVSITDQGTVLQRIVDGAIQVADATMAWLLLRSDDNKSFLLTAQRGLPDVWAKKMNTPLDDGISSLVALSGESLTIEGEPLLKFRVANFGKAACAVPVKIQREVIGTLVAVRKELRPFQKIEETLLEAVADYTSLYLVNARLFRALNDTRQATREVEKRQNAVVESIRGAITEDLKAATYPIDLLLTEMTGNLSGHQREALKTARAALQRITRSAEKTTPPAPISLKKQ
jgi:FixJ family two-component response regulator